MVGNPSARGISMISVRGQHKELNTARPAGRQRWDDKVGKIKVREVNYVWISF
jgi:hypothetical protein